MFIIRPWEGLFPGLEPYHVERTYCLAVIALTFLAGELRLRGSSQTFSVAIFVVALVLSGLFAFDGDAAWEGLYEYLPCVMFYIVLVSVIRTPYALVFIVIAYVVVMALYLGKSEVEFLFFHAARFDQGVTRMCGIDRTFSGPNEVAESAALTLPMAFFLWQSRHIFTRHWPNTHRLLFPWCVGFYVVLAITAIALTNSRSGMLAVVMFFVVAAASQRSLKKTITGAHAAVWLFRHCLDSHVRRATRATIHCLEPGSRPESRFRVGLRKSSGV